MYQLRYNWNFINLIFCIVGSETINQDLDENDILETLALTEDDLQNLLEESEEDS